MLCQPVPAKLTGALLLGSPACCPAPGRQSLLTSLRPCITTATTWCKRWQRVGCLCVVTNAARCLAPHGTCWCPSWLTLRSHAQLAGELLAMRPEDRPDATDEREERRRRDKRQPHMAAGVVQVGVGAPFSFFVSGAGSLVPLTIIPPLLGPGWHASLRVQVLGGPLPMLLPCDRVFLQIKFFFGPDTGCSRALGRQPLSNSVG